MVRCGAQERLPAKTTSRRVVQYILFLILSHISTRSLDTPRHGNGWARLYSRSDCESRSARPSASSSDIRPSAAPGAVPPATSASAAPAVSGRRHTSAAQPRQSQQRHASPRSPQPCTRRHALLPKAENRAKLKNSNQENTNLINGHHIKPYPRRKYQNNAISTQYIPGQ